MEFISLRAVELNTKRSSTAGKGKDCGSFLWSYAVALSLAACYSCGMLSQFIDKKLRGARYKLLKDGSYFGEIPGLKGVWADAKSLEDCRRQLQEVLEDWLVLKIHDGDAIPGFEMKIDQRELVKHA